MASPYAYPEVYLLTARPHHIRMGALSFFVFVSLVSLSHIAVVVVVGNIAGASGFVCEPILLFGEQTALPSFIVFL